MKLLMSLVLIVGIISTGTAVLAAVGPQDTPQYREEEENEIEYNDYAAHKRPRDQDRAIFDAE